MKRVAAFFMAAFMLIGTMGLVVYAGQDDRIMVTVLVSPDPEWGTVDGIKQEGYYSFETAKLTVATLPFYTVDKWTCGDKTLSTGKECTFSPSEYTAGTELTVYCVLKACDCSQLIYLGSDWVYDSIGHSNAYCSICSGMFRNIPHADNNGDGLCDDCLYKTGNINSENWDDVSYSVNISVIPEGSAETSGTTLSYTANESVELIAYPYDGYAFDGWYSCKFSRFSESAPLQDKLISTDTNLKFSIYDYEDSNTTYIKYTNKSGDYPTNATVYFIAKFRPIPSTVEEAPAPIQGLVYSGAAQKLVVGGSAKNGNMFYKVDDGEWSNSIPTAAKAGDYTVYYKALGMGGGSEVNYVKAHIEARTAAFSWSDEPLIYNGTEQKPELTLTNKADGDIVEFVIAGGGTDVGENYTASLLYMNGKDAGNYKLPDETVMKEFAISPANQDAPTGVSKTDETICSANDGKISGVTTAMEFAYERGSYNPCKSTEITGLKPGTYHVRFASDKNHNPSDAVQIVIGKGACHGGVATCTTQAKCEGCGNGYGELNPDNHNCSYKSDETGHWMECACGYKETAEEHKDADHNLRCDACGYDLSGKTKINGFPSMESIPYGKTISMGAESNYGRIVYTSSNPDVASVDENGVVTGNYKGECVVTAQVEGSDIKSECTVKVSMTFWQMIQYLFSKLFSMLFGF